MVVSYVFGQSGEIGATRVRALAAHLPALGWKPTILTTKVSSPHPADWDVIEVGDGDPLRAWRRLARPFAAVLSGNSSGAQNSSPQAPVLIRLWKTLFAYPDVARPWVAPAIEAGRRLLTHQQYDVILSSALPASSHLVASRLSKEFGIPWIADYRDLWTQNHYYNHRGLRRFLERRLERRTLQQAYAMCTVSEPLAEHLRTLHAPIETFTVPNGFETPQTPMGAKLTSKFTITHTGRLYQRKRDPEPLFRVLGDLINEGRIKRDDVEVRFYGPPEPWLDKLVADAGLIGVVHQLGRVPSATAVSAQTESQILLLLTWDHPEERGVYTGKVFEYLAAGRPILSLGAPPGVLTHLLSSTSTGVHLQSKDEMRVWITSAYDAWRATGEVPYKSNQTALAEYTHERLAQRTAALLNKGAQQKVPP